MSESAFIVQKFAGVPIRMRNDNTRYVSGTDICKAFGKFMGDYNRNAETKLFLDKLSTSMEFPIDLLITKVVGGVNENRGTWVHPQVAIHLAFWASPEFAVQVTQWIQRYFDGDISLVKDVLDQYDRVHDTTSVADITSRENVSFTEEERQLCREERRHRMRMEEEQWRMEVERINMESKRLCIESGLFQLQVIDKMKDLAEEYKTINPKLFTYANDQLMNTVANFGGKVVGFLPPSRTFLPDVVTMIRELGYTTTKHMNRASVIGRKISAEYKRRYNQAPEEADRIQDIIHADMSHL
jgi:hypothetical protein